MKRILAILFAAAAISVPCHAHTMVVTNAKAEVEPGAIEMNVELTREAAALYATSHYGGKTEVSLSDFSKRILDEIQITADGKRLTGRALSVDPAPTLAAAIDEGRGVNFRYRWETENPREVGFSFRFFQGVDEVRPLYNLSYRLPGQKAVMRQFFREDVFTVAIGEGKAASEGFVDTLARFVVLGVQHIVPDGLDHVLFILGLYLSAVAFLPLLKQVTAFTLAHSITLVFSMLGVVSLPAHVVEPVIALSIAVIAVENVLMPSSGRSRWILVFVFGLIHGMGFAGVLSELDMPQQRFVPALLGFNVGVELGQLAVIAAAAACTAWFMKRSWYRRIVVIPASLAIAAVGLFWTVERIFF